MSSPQPSRDGGAGALPEWEGRAAFDIGVMIARYLAEHPAPAASSDAFDYAGWSSKLRAHGEQRLEVAGGRRLLVVSDERGIVTAPQTQEQR